MANERTFLAWVRTSVSIMTLGIAVNKLSLALVQADRLQVDQNAMLDAADLGTGLVLLGMLALLGGAIRYQQVGKHIDALSYQPLRAKAWILAGAILISGVASLIWLNRHS